MFAVGVGLVFALALAGDVSEFPACVALVVGEVASAVASAAPSFGSPSAPTSSSASTVRGGCEGGSHMLPDRFLDDCRKVRGGGAVGRVGRKGRRIMVLGGAVNQAGFAVDCLRQLVQVLADVGWLNVKHPCLVGRFDACLEGVDEVNHAHSSAGLDDSLSGCGDSPEVGDNVLVAALCRV